MDSQAAPAPHFCIPAPHPTPGPSAWNYLIPSLWVSLPTASSTDPVLGPKLWSSAASLPGAKLALTSCFSLASEPWPATKMWIHFVLWKSCITGLIQPWLMSSRALPCFSQSLGFHPWTQDQWEETCYWIKDCLTLGHLLGSSKYPLLLDLSFCRVTCLCLPHRAPLPSNIPLEHCDPPSFLGLHMACCLPKQVAFPVCSGPSAYGFVPSPLQLNCYSVQPQLR